MSVHGYKKKYIIHTYIKSVGRPVSRERLPQRFLYFQSVLVFFWRLKYVRILRYTNINNTDDQDEFSKKKMQVKNILIIIKYETVLIIQNVYSYWKQVPIRINRKSQSWTFRKLIRRQSNQES